MVKGDGSQVRRNYDETLNGPDPSQMTDMGRMSMKWIESIKTQGHESKSRSVAMEDEVKGDRGMQSIEI